MSETSTTSAAGNSDDFDLSDSGVASLFGGGAGTTSTTTETDSSSQTTNDEDTTSSTDTTDTGTSDDNTNGDETGTTTDDDDDNSAGAGDTSSSPKFDTDLDDWAAKTGRATPTTDAERQLLQDLRNSSRDFTRSRQQSKAAKDMQTAVTDTDPAKGNQATNTDDDDDGDPLVGKVSTLEAQLAAERNNRLQSEFYQSANDGKGVTTEEGEAMVAVFKDKVDKGGKPAFDHWSNPANLEDLHQLAKVRLAEQTRTAEVERTRKEERERLAKLQQANGPAQNAKTTQTKQTKSAEEIRNEMWRSND